MSEHDSADTALKLAELRGALEVGLARIDGRLAVLVQENSRNERAVSDLEDRVTALEKARWPLPAVSVLCALVTAAIALWAVLGA